MGNEHSYVKRYRVVWDATLANNELSAEQVEKSRYYFEADLSTPTPREFDTFGVVALMPMPEEAQVIFTKLWSNIIESLGYPLAYAVKPQNRHIELILFSRPEENFPDAVIRSNVEASFKAVKASRPKPFKVTFTHPFITPDGTIVVPGLPFPETAINGFRANIREATNGMIPERQSQWLHVSLGRILEPLDAKRFGGALKILENNWSKPVIELTVNELYWTHEKQWYMLKKDVLHKLPLSV